MDPQRQMWAFAQEFIEKRPHKSSSSSARGNGNGSGSGHGNSSSGHSGDKFPVEVVLRFLFQLSFCRVGQDYPIAALGPQEELLLNKFVEFGFIYRRQR